jgi:heme-degrading monooxygenase HmoA
MEIDGSHILPLHNFSWRKPMTARFAPRPDAPYYAVIFASQHSGGGGADYAATAQRMFDLAAKQPGYVGVESAHGADGFGITVSYWDSLEAISAWRKHAEHTLARERGRAEWYSGFELRIAKIERAYGFRAEG